MNDTSRNPDGNAKPDLHLSPYEKGYNAESDEKAFRDMTDLLRSKPKDSSRRGPVASDAAIELFGSQLAGSLTTTYAGIDISGMIYGFDWMSGRIRGVDCGKIPKPMLLLCLQTDRIATRAADELAASMEKAIRQLELCSIVKESISHWNLENVYTNLAACHDQNYSFPSNKIRCQKCVIFVARAFSCIMALKQEAGDSLIGKVRACLTIMNAHVGESAPIAKSKANNGVANSKGLPPSLLKRKVSGDGPTGTYKRLPTGPTTGKAIEKLCLKTGKVLERFDSVRAATSFWPPQSQENSRKRLYDALTGQRPSFQGFFWRYAGSSITPPDRSDGDSLDLGSTSLHPPGSHHIGTSSDMPTSFDPGLLGPRIHGPSHVLLQNLGAKAPRFSSNSGRSTSSSTTLIADNPSIPAAKHIMDLPRLTTQGDDGLPGATNELSAANRLLAQQQVVEVEPNNEVQCYPDDPDELILNANEIELSWLCEESIYCRERNEIHWPFIYKYASHSLQMKLRMVRADESNKLDRLVRFDNIMVSRRFPIKRKIIRRTMHNGEFRKRMRNVIVQHRRAVLRERDNWKKGFLLESRSSDTF